LPPSTTAPGDTPNGDDGKRYRLRLHREVAVVVEKLGDDPRFRPSLDDIFESLKTDPKQHPKKRGPLKDHRAASLRFGVVSWRCVFRIDEAERIVYVQSLAKHDTAYEEAEKRA
jgi:mRNA-degrading endonuclease RelE of RelBE toxin-antitoxin system